MSETSRRMLTAVFIGAAVVAPYAMASQALAQQTLQYTYDELGRLKNVTYPDGKQIVYRYDAAGNRTQHIVSSTAVDNSPPLAGADGIFADNNVGYSVVFDPRWNDSDPDNGPLTITAKTNGTKGTVTIGGNGTTLLYVFTGSPPPTYSFDTDTFTYTITDNYGLVATANVAVDIYTGCPPVPPGQDVCVIE